MLPQLLVLLVLDLPVLEGVESAHCWTLSLQFCSERAETWMEEATRHQNGDGSSRGTLHVLANSIHHHRDSGNVASRVSRANSAWQGDVQHKQEPGLV